MLEVIAILVVLGILIAVAASRLSSSGNELYTERDLLKSNLRFAQLKALTSNNDDGTTWRVTFAGDSYTLTKILKDGSTDTSVNSNFPSDNSPTHNLTGGVAITVPSSVTYDFWGSPGTDDITLTLNQGGQTISFIITRTTGFIQ